MIDPNATLASLAESVPNASRVFETLGIDYACSGDLRLEEACTLAHLVLGEVVGKLETASLGHHVAKSEDLVSLIDHIISNHHGYTRAELARVTDLSDALAKERGKERPELYAVADLVGQLSAELLAHMDREEKILFPYIISLETFGTKGQIGRPPFGSIRNPITRMRRDHETTNILLRAIRTATSEFRLDGGAPEAQKELFAELVALEADLHEHMHLENNVLFTRAAALEERAA